jgi:hypothetical protein
MGGRVAICSTFVPNLSQHIQNDIQPLFNVSSKKQERSGSSIGPTALRFFE